MSTFSEAHAQLISGKSTEQPAANQTVFQKAHTQLIQSNQVKPTSVVAIKPNQKKIDPKALPTPQKDFLTQANDAFKQSLSAIGGALKSPLGKKITSSAVGATFGAAPLAGKIPEAHFADTINQYTPKGFKGAATAFGAGLAQGLVNTPAEAQKGVKSLQTNIDKGTSTPKQVAADIAAAIQLPLLFIGGGEAAAIKLTGEQIARQTLMQGAKIAAKSAVKTAGVGAGFGLVSGIQSGKEITNLNDYLKNLLVNVGIGAALGQGASLVTHGIQKIAVPLAKGLSSKMGAVFIKNSGKTPKVDHLQIDPKVAQGMVMKDEKIQKSQVGKAIMKQALIAEQTGQHVTITPSKDGKITLPGGQKIDIGVAPIYEPKAPMEANAGLSDTEKIFNNLDQEDLKIHGNNISKLHGIEDWQRGIKGEGARIVSKVNPQDIDQINILNTSSKIPEVRHDTRQFLNILGDRVPDDQKLGMLQDFVNNELITKGTPEGRLIESIVNKMLQGEKVVSNPSDYNKYYNAYLGKRTYDLTQSSKAPTEIKEVSATKTVPLSKVSTGLSDLTASRVKTDTPKIKAYEEAIQKGEKLPAIPVYEENGKYVLNKDGFHRYQAQKNLGVKDIAVKIEPKTDLSASGKQRVENKVPETSPKAQQAPSKAKEVQSPSSGTPNPVGTGKPRESEAFRKFTEQLKESDPKRYEELQGKKVTYNKLNLQKDAENAMKLVEKDPEQAYRIAKGVESAPDGQTETAISIALANRAGEEKNFEMQADLESSRSLRQTRRGQEIVSERGRFTENSPHAFIQRVLDERLKRIGSNFITKNIDTIKALKGKADTAKTRAIAKIDEQVEKAITYTKKERAKIRSAQQVLDALTCK